MFRTTPFECSLNTNKIIFELVGEACDGIKSKMRENTNLF